MVFCWSERTRSSSLPSIRRRASLPMRRPTDSPKLPSRPHKGASQQEGYTNPLRRAILEVEERLLTAYPQHTAPWIKLCQKYEFCETNPFLSTNHPHRAKNKPIFQPASALISPFFIYPTSHSPHPLLQARDRDIRGRGHVNPACDIWTPVFPWLPRGSPRLCRG